MNEKAQAHPAGYQNDNQSNQLSQHAFREFISTPVGELQICANNEGICALLYAPEAGAIENANAHTQNAKQQLVEYFDGQRQHFELPLSVQGTEFQQLVWHQLSCIPFGECRSYKDIALALDKPKAMRAVGAANGRNPLPVIVPCHRVIGSSGALTGFAGGLEMKEWLLRHEGYLLV